MAIVAASVPSVGVEAASNSFSDVKAGSFYYEAVKALQAQGVIKGYADGTFKPDQKITRAEVAYIIASSLQLSSSSSSKFKDVQKGQWYYDAVTALEKAGIMNGRTQDSFNPNELITRSELAKVISLGYDLKENPEVAKSFKDINSKAWYKGYVGALIENKITSGVSATAFAPESAATRGQVAAFIYRADNNSKTKIDSITASSIKLGGKEYKLDSSLTPIFSEANAAALKNAFIRFKEKDGVITAISYLELTQSGTKEKPLVLDGKKATFGGNIKVTGDYFSINNLTIKGNLELSKNFSSQNLVVEGVTRINSSEVSIASNSAITFNLDNSSFNTVNVNGGKMVSILTNGASKISDLNLNQNAFLHPSAQTLIRAVNILSGANKVEFKGNIDEVYVNTNGSLTLAGQANIDKLRVQKLSELILELQGRINELKAEQLKQIMLKQQTIIGNLLLEIGKKAADFFKDYDKVKYYILNIGGVQNPDVPYTPSLPRDTTPPIISGVSSGNITTASFDVQFTVNEPGQLYYVVLPANAPQPSSVQVKAGENGSGEVASIQGSKAATATNELIEVGNLEENTDYHLYLVAEDRYGNLSNIASLNVKTLPVDQTPPSVFEDEVLSFDTDNNKLIDHVLVRFTEDLKSASLQSDEVQVSGYTITNAQTLSLGDLTAIIGMPQVQISSTSAETGMGNFGSLLFISLEEDETAPSTPTVTIKGNVLQDLSGNYFAGMDNVTTTYANVWDWLIK